MADYDVREAICEVGRRAWQRGMVASNDGNISYRLDERTVLATPTMVSKGFMTPDDLVLVSLDGDQVGGTRRLTTEIRLHLHIYQRRPDIRSVVHVHPPDALTFAATRTPFPRGIIPEIEWNLGEVPLAPYALQGTWEFARSLDPWLDTHDAFLMANHGTVTVGADPFDAWYRTEVVENYARLVLNQRLLGREFVPLEEEQLSGLMAAKRAAGLADQGAGLSYRERLDPVVRPRRAAPPAPFRSEPFTGEWPMVSDEPKPSTAPEPLPD